MIENEIVHLWVDPTRCNRLVERIMQQNTNEASEARDYGYALEVARFDNGSHVSMAMFSILAVHHNEAELDPDSIY